MGRLTARRREKMKEKAVMNKVYDLVRKERKEKDILERIGFAVRVGEKFPTTFPQDQVNKFVELAYELGKKEGRESVIKEIEKMFYMGNKKTKFIYWEEWESFKKGSRERFPTSKRER